MPRLIFITVLLLNICACGLVPEAPVDPEEKARQAAEAQARYEQRQKAKAEWPEKFLDMPQKPVSPLIDAWGKPDGAETDQSGARMYRWIKEDVSYPPSSSSRQPIYNEKGDYVGSYEVPAAPTAPIRTIDCEIHITADAAGLITYARYGGPYCYLYFPIP